MLPFGSKRRPAPVSNTERQRQFRDRNPGYYGRLHRKRKAKIEALAAQRAMAAAQLTQSARTQLLLPAPVEQSGQLTFFDFLQTAAQQRERELAPIRRAA